MNAHQFKVGTARSAMFSPKAPTEHAVGEGLSIAVCGATVRAGSRWFAFSPFVCKRCVRSLNAAKE